MSCVCLKPQKFPDGVDKPFPTGACGTTPGESGTGPGMTPVGRHSLRTPCLQWGSPWEWPQAISPLCSRVNYYALADSNVVVSDYLLLRVCSLRTDHNSSPGAAASGGLGYGFTACFPCAEPSDCKTTLGGDMQHPGTGREQLYLEAQLPALLRSISGKWDLRPPWGSSPQLRNCRLRVWDAVPGAATRRLEFIAGIHPCAVSQAGSHHRPRRGNFPAPLLGHWGHFWHLKVKVEVDLCNYKSGFG